MKLLREQILILAHVPKGDFVLRRFGGVHDADATGRNRVVTRELARSSTTPGRSSGVRVGPPSPAGTGFHGSRLGPLARGSPGAYRVPGVQGLNPGSWSWGMSR